MGNGLPIAGIVARHDILHDFGHKARYFNTFGGNPVCIAAATAVLDVLETERLPVNAATTGAYLKDRITQLATTTPLLGDVRGAGLYLGIDATSPETGQPSAETASAIVNAMRERRVLISATGPHGSVLKIRPPLCFDPEHADQFLNVLSEVIAAWR
jgi:4-aminobutyrate aminotransferase-like enzyme